MFVLVVVIFVVLKRHLIGVLQLGLKDQQKQNSQAYESYRLNPSQQVSQEFHE